jgi:MerR family redox-sensitive transcriptional activator SoxR
MKELTIGEVARQAGLQTSALRYYESVGLLPAPDRQSGQRRYAAEILPRLAFIKLSQQAGFTIAEIHTLLEGFEEATPPSARWRIMAQSKLGELAALIERAQQMRHLLEDGMQCGCLSFEECLPLLNEKGECQRGC